MGEAAISISCPCDAPAGGMLSVDEARQRLYALLMPASATESLPLAEAAGRIVAKPLHASCPMPFFDNSAMDGFAVSLADFENGPPHTLPISGAVAAGDHGAPALAPGACMRIFTGAPIPANADAVVPFEQTAEEQGCAAFFKAPRPGAHIRRAGCDIARDDVLVAPGTRMSGRYAGLLAANGHLSVTVYRQPRIGVFSTGDELVAASHERRAFELHDANRPMLLMMLQEMGCAPVDLGILPDDPFETRQFLHRHAGDFDLLISSGAVSVGGRDFLKGAFSSAGGVIDSWKVALKPGKPVMFGRIGKTAFLGLPGNPMAAWIGFQLFGRMAVERLSGRATQPVEPVRAITEGVIRHRLGRREYVPVRVVSHTHRGQPLLARIGHGGSASLYPLCFADGVAIIEATTGDAEAGEELDFLPFVQGVLE